MVDIRVQSLADALGAPVVTGAILVAQVFEGHSPATRVAGEDVTFPVLVRVNLTGAADEFFALYTLPPNLYWRIVVTVPPYNVTRNVVLPAGAGPFDFADLVDVDPTTALPDPGSALADAFIAELEAIRDATIAVQGGMVTSGSVVGDDLILEHADATTVNAGNVRGPQGIPGIADDASVAAQVSGGPLTVAALDATIPTIVGPLLPSGGRTTLTLGDSHAAGVGVTNATTRAFPRQMRHAAGTYYASEKNAIVSGNAGETTAQLLARLPGLLASNQMIDTVVFEGGANDVNQAVPVSTTAANWESVTVMCRERGINVILVGVPPKPDDASVTDAMCRQVESLNTLLLVQAPRWGALVADIHPTLTDPTTGRLKSIYTDVPTLHMNNLAHYYIANIIGPLLRETYPQQPLPIPTGAMRMINLCQNGGFLDGTAPLPTGWSSVTDTAGTVTASTSTVDDDTTGYLPFGKWLTMDVTMGATTGSYGRAYSLGSIAAGTELALTGYLMVEDISGDWLSAATDATANIFLILTRPNFLTYNLMTPSSDGFAGVPIGGNKYLIGPIYTRGTVASTDTVFVKFGFTQPPNTHFKFSFGAAECINLTDNGLTTLA